MGNFRFKLSDMMPNSWFYKLNEMRKTRKRQHKKHTSFSSSSPISATVVADQRKSYYCTRDLTKSTTSDQHEPPRKSSRRSTKRNPPPYKLVSSSVSAGCSCRATLQSVWTKLPEDYSNSLLSPKSTSDNDSILSDRGLYTFDNDIETKVDTIPEKDHLPPIITTKQDPTKISEKNAFGLSLSVKVVKEIDNDFKDHHHHQTKKTASPVRRYATSNGVRLRTNSPRIGNRRISHSRRSVSSNSSCSSQCSIAESFAVMKSSEDPGRDFRESMVEMIIENNIRASRDLEELLACYLELNANEYHDLIINVFKQIWFDFLHE